MSLNSHSSTCVVALNRMTEGQIHCSLNPLWKMSWPTCKFLYPLNVKFFGTSKKKKKTQNSKEDFSDEKCFIRRRLEKFQTHCGAMKWFDAFKIFSRMIIWVTYGQKVTFSHSAIIYLGPSRNQWMHRTLSCARPQPRELHRVCLKYPAGQCARPSLNHNGPFGLCGCPHSAPFSISRRHPQVLGLRSSALYLNQLRFSA